MSNQRYLNELEDFLAQEADSHRLYPSDRVWLNIAKKVQPEIKWPALTFSAILLGALYILGIIFIHPDKDLWTPDTTRHTGAKPAVKDRLAKAVQRASALSNEMVLTPSGFQAPSNIAANHFIGFPSVPQDQITELEPDTATSGLVHLSNLPSVPNTSFLAQPAWRQSTIQMPEVRIMPRAGVLQPVSVNDELEKTNQEQTARLHEPEHHIDSAVAEASVAPEARTAPASLTAMQKANTPMPQANALSAVSRNTMKATDRLEIRFYATPSISYRMLFDNKGADFHYANSSLRGPVAPNWVNNVSSFVRHKPLVGLEAGSAVSYMLTRNLKLRAGLQLNYRQYQTEAFRGDTDKALVLLERNGNVDTLTSISNLVNQTGKFDINLTNRWAELAVPIGFDVEVAQGKMGKLFVSGTLQPTYTFYAQGYLLSTDFSRYIDRQDLFRKFNLNSSLEAYLEVPGNGFKWQIGPQIRYQMLPGTVPGYNVRQHLIDYGMKIGVMKSIRRRG